ncbi:MAG: Radical domain protein [Firmicutes bacterium]|nr:Radical domain protein [Bacillota bacterium]
MKKSHQAEVQKLILNSAAEGNILPITSRCDSHCIFCSHKNNPPEIDVISIGVRTLEEITQTMNYLVPNQAIIIGESASSIIEGEPFTHPNFREILTILHQRFPLTPIGITTNGHHLSSDIVDFIGNLGNISLNISLNSASLYGRKLLMGNTAEQARKTIAGIKFLASQGIAYNSSMVAMPHVTGWNDMKNTIQFLSENKASVIRVFMPAFSNKALHNISPENATSYEQLREFILSLSTELACPVLLEPSYVTDLTPVISGVAKDSPAWLAGLRRGDVVCSINQKKPRCRVEAWNMLVPQGPLQVVALKNGQEQAVSWQNDFDGGSGIAMEYDFDMRRAEHIQQLVLRRPGKSLLLTSEFGHVVVQTVLASLGLVSQAEAVLVKNLTFGGTIKASGLLTVDDYYAAFKTWQVLHQEKPEQIFVPMESFNSLGFDLKHKHFKQLTNLTGVPVLPT